MARWEDERRRSGGQGFGRDDRFAGRGEPWPGQGQRRNRDEGGEGDEREGRPGERADPAREDRRPFDARSAGSRGHDFGADRGRYAGRWERVSARREAEPSPEPAVGDEGGGWRRSTQFELTGTGPGSYGPEEERGGRGWRARPLGRGPKSYRRPDARIQDDLSERLALSNLRTDEVEVAVADGVVTLSGRVESRWDKRAIEELAEDTFGVTEVANRLRIDSPMDRARRANRVGDDTGEDLHH
jgi:hypothetical protein